MTCIVRSRTWSVQMKDTTGFVYDDLRVIGGNPGNANQDGMDWLGGGDALVRDAFLRASDDDIAMQGNWDGYTDEEMLRPGHDVENITIENSELSTSISNIVRSAWPRKTFNSRNFTLRDSDILHSGIGACGQTFAVLGMWGANGAKGDHSGYTFENLWLDNWYSLAQIEQEEPSIHNFIFKNIWALDQPPLASSTITGDVLQGVTFDNIKYDQNRAANEGELQLITSGGAEPPRFPAPSGPVAHFTFSPPVFGPGDQVTFMADPATPVTHGFSGMAPHAHGRSVKHKFPDALGTAYDGVTARGGFAFCSKLKMQTSIRIGPRRASSRLPNGTRLRLPQDPRCPGSSTASIPAHGLSCPVSLSRHLSSAATRPTSASIRTASRGISRPGTDSSMFLPMAATRSI